MTNDLLQLWNSIALNWRGFLETLKIVFFVVDILLIIGIAVLWYLAWPYRVHFTYNPYAGKKKKIVSNKLFERHWEKITHRLREGTPDTLRLAVIEADKLADNILKAMRFKGEHMADRLQQITSEELKSLDGLWKAHRTRNDLVHTPGFTLTPEDARQTIKYYEAFFTEVGVLESPAEKKKKEEEEEKEKGHGEHRKSKEPEGHGKEEIKEDDFW